MSKNIKLRNMTAIYISRENEVCGKEMLMLYRIGSRVVEPSWCGIGGHFERDELNDPKACVLREMEEEIGLVPEALTEMRLKYVTLRLKNGEIRQNYYYFAELAAGAEVCPVSDEGKVKWVPFDEILGRKMPLTAKQMLSHYMETGRFDEKIYSGTTQEDHMAFAELKEF